MPRKQSQTIATLEELGLENPLIAVPVPEQGVKAKYDPKKRAQLRRTLPPKPGIYSFVASKCGYKHHVRIDLDETGSLFWKHVDSKHSIEQIAEPLQKHLGCSPQEARTACITFARDLMLRRMICLRLPATADEPARDLRMRTK